MSKDRGWNRGKRDRDAMGLFRQGGRLSDNVGRERNIAQITAKALPIV